MLDLKPVAARQVRLSASRSRPSAVNGPYRCREMFFALTEAAATRHRNEQALVRSSIERRELQPLLQVAARLNIRNAVYQLREQRQVPGPEAPTLGKKPARELRAALNLQSFEKVAVKEREEFARPFSRKRAYARLRGASLLKRVHASIGQIEPDAMLPAGHSRVADDAAQLAQ